MAVSTETTDARRARELERAFEDFATVSRELETSYAALERRSQRLTEELERVRRDRRRQADQRLIVARRLEGLLAAMPAGVLVLDGADVVTQANPCAIDLLGEPLLGRRWQEISARSFRDLAGDGEILLKDGRRLSLCRRSLAPETGQILVITDTTDRRAMEELLSRHQRLSAMGEVAASLAHQIRTPLASALLYASSAADPATDVELRRGLSQKIVASLHDLERLIEDMLMFARGGIQAEAGVRLSDLLANIDACLQPQIRDGQSVAFRLEDEQLGVVGNEQALAGALLNLVKNALEMSGDAAEVCVTATAHNGETVDIEVSDNGPGVAVGMEDEIFKPFFSTRSGGTGLGLAVVRSVARSHGGDVFVDSSYRDGGAFVLRLPLVALDHVASDREVAA